MSVVLQQTLRQLCCGTGWDYAVFWKLNRNSMRLMWEDGHYNDGTNYSDKGLAMDSALLEKLGESIARFSFHVYAFGEGIIGRVAFTNKHQWVFTPCERRGCDQSIPRANGLDKFPAEWQTQFMAGIKTIAVISVPGGVVQFGSAQIMEEDLSLVQLARGRFSQLQSIPDAFLPYDLSTDSSTKSSLAQMSGLVVPGVSDMRQGPFAVQGTAAAHRFSPHMISDDMSRCQAPLPMLTQASVNFPNQMTMEDCQMNGWPHSATKLQPWKSAPAADNWASRMTDIDSLLAGQSQQLGDLRAQHSGGSHVTCRKRPHPSAVSPLESSLPLNSGQGTGQDLVCLPNGGRERTLGPRSTAGLHIEQIPLKAFQSDPVGYWETRSGHIAEAPPLSSVLDGPLAAGVAPAKPLVALSPHPQFLLPLCSEALPSPRDLQPPTTSSMDTLSGMCGLQEVQSMGFPTYLLPTLSAGTDLFQAMNGSFPQLEEGGPDYLSKLVHCADVKKGGEVVSADVMCHRDLLGSRKANQSGELLRTYSEDGFFPASMAVKPEAVPFGLPPASSALESPYAPTVAMLGGAEDIAGTLAFAGPLGKPMQYSTLKSFDVVPSDLSAPSRRPWQAYMGPESSLVGYELFEALGTAMTGQKTNAGSESQMLESGASQQEAPLPAVPALPGAEPAPPAGLSSGGASQSVDSVLAGIASGATPAPGRHAEFEMLRLSTMDAMSGRLVDVSAASGSKGANFGLGTEGSLPVGPQRLMFSAKREAVVEHDSGESTEPAPACNAGAVAAAAKADAFEDDMGDDVLREDGKKSKKKGKGKSGEGPRPRPKDRQQIQDRVKHLRGIISNSQKLSIDGLLDKTIEHMKFLRETIGRHKRYRLEEDDYGGKHRKCLADAMSPVGNLSQGVSVHLLRESGQFLVEVKCGSDGLLLEVAEVLKSLKLVIRRGVSEAYGDNLWGRYIVQATAPVQRATIYWVLVQKLKQHGAVDAALASPNSESSALDQQQKSCAAYVQSHVHNAVEELGTCAYPLPVQMPAFESRLRAQCC